MMTTRAKAASPTADSGKARDQSPANTKKMEGHSAENDLPQTPGEPTYQQNRNLSTALGDAISLTNYLNPNTTH